MEHDGTRWNTMEHDGTRWNTMEHIEYLWRKAVFMWPEVTLCNATQQAMHQHSTPMLPSNTWGRRKQIWSGAAMGCRRFRRPLWGPDGGPGPSPGKNWKLKLKCLFLGTFQGILNYMYNYLHCTRVSSTRTPCTWLHCNLSPPIRISTHGDTYMYASLLALSHS